jgi:hypothetical protein
MELTDRKNKLVKISEGRRSHCSISHIYVNICQSLCHSFVDNKIRFNERETILRLNSLVSNLKGKKKQNLRYSNQPYVLK